MEFKIPNCNPLLRYTSTTDESKSLSSFPFPLNHDHGNGGASIWLWSFGLRRGGRSSCVYGVVVVHRVSTTWWSFVVCGKTVYSHPIGLSDLHLYSHVLCRFWVSNPKVHFYLLSLVAHLWGSYSHAIFRRLFDCRLVCACSLVVWVVYDDARVDVGGHLVVLCTGLRRRLASLR